MAGRGGRDTDGQKQGALRGEGGTQRGKKKGELRGKKRHSGRETEREGGGNGREIRRKTKAANIEE